MGFDSLSSKWNNTAEIMMKEHAQRAPSFPVLKSFIQKNIEKQTCWVISFSLERES